MVVHTFAINTRPGSPRQNSLVQDDWVVNGRRAVVVVESSWWWVPRHESFDVGLLFSSGGRDATFRTLGICFGAFTGERVLLWFITYLLRSFLMCYGIQEATYIEVHDHDYHPIKYIHKTAECGCRVLNLGRRRLRFYRRQGNNSQLREFVSELLTDSRWLAMPFFPRLYFHFFHTTASIVSVYGWNTLCTR